MTKKELADELRLMCELRLNTQEITVEDIWTLAETLDPPGCKHEWENGMIFRNTTKSVWVKRCRKCHKVKAPVLGKDGFLMDYEWETIFDGLKEQEDGNKTNDPRRDSVE